MGEKKKGPLRVEFDREIKLEFHGAKVLSDGGLLIYRELDEALEPFSKVMSEWSKFFC